MTPCIGLSAGVSELVTPEFLGGDSSLGDYTRFQVDLGFRVDREPIEELLLEAVRRFAKSKERFESDAWLAPRLHNLVRLDRRRASEPALWRYLALVVGDRYVRFRWAKETGWSPARYLGGTNFLRRNALSRLWWAAEATRNGSDYEPVALVLKSSQADQYTLDSKFSHLRAAAIAFAQVVDGAALDFERTKELAKRVNLLLAGTALESLSTADETDGQDQEWYGGSISVAELVRTPTAKLHGPDTGAVSPDETADYRTWFAQVAKQLPD